jgi:hypothetical protein
VESAMFVSAQAALKDGQAQEQEDPSWRLAAAS